MKSEGITLQEFAQAFFRFAKMSERHFMKIDATLDDVFVYFHKIENDIAKIKKDIDVLTQKTNYLYEKTFEIDDRLTKIEDRMSFVEREIYEVRMDMMHHRSTVV